MGHTFTKLFNSILQSTIWIAPDSQRILWIAMLAMADRQGRIYASIPGLANTARLPVSEVEAGLLAFMSPDVYSRTKDNEGRRIAETDDGWVLLNHDKFRALRDQESVKESKRRYINARRARERDVDIEVHSRPLCTQAEAEAEAEEVQKKPPNGAGSDVWSLGLELLKDTGTAEPTARKFLGSLQRDYGDVDLTEAIRASVGKTDPKSYIMGVLKNIRKKSDKPAPYI
mgnify:CR=1 FL=1